MTWDKTGPRVSLAADGATRVDQVQDSLRPVKDAHAEGSNLTGGGRAGLGGDIGPGEAVVRLPIDPGEGRCDELGEGFRLRFLVVSCLGLERAVQRVGQLVKEDGPVRGSECDDLLLVVGHSIDARRDAKVVDAHPEPLGHVEEWGRVSGFVGRELGAFGILVPEYGHGLEAHEDVDLISVGIGVV